MLKIKIEAKEDYDPVKNEFFYTKEQTIVLEHSLVSLAKWESKWCKPFLSSSEHSKEEMIDYIKCMTISQNVDPEIYNHLSDSEMMQIVKYIEAPMTAMTIMDLEKDKKVHQEGITAETFYYQMTALNIPFECQKWHLNRLAALIKFCAIKSQPPKKMSKRASGSYYNDLNKARKAKYGIKG